MGKVERFEDLIAWQKARLLTRDVYRVAKQGEVASDYGLARQIQRASVSIMSNVAEGFDRAGRGEFHQFVSTAKASCAETRSLLYVALDAEYLDPITFQQLAAQAAKSFVSSLVFVPQSTANVTNNEHRGAKHET